MFGPLLVRHDVKQLEVARMLLESLTTECPGYICREVMIELVWVLDAPTVIPVIRLLRYGNNLPQVKSIFQKDIMAVFSVLRTGLHHSESYDLERRLSTLQFPRRFLSCVGGTP